MYVYLTPHSICPIFVRVFFSRAIEAMCRHDMIVVAST